MKFDLHCHTTASDGTLTPQELVDRALSRDLELLSITDHDSVEAYRNLSVPGGLRIVPGVEFSCQWRKYSIHIVGLGIDLDATVMAEAVAHQSVARNRRAEMIAERLQKYGVEDPLEGALREAAGGTVGRPHFARHLVNTGFVASESIAFKKFLGAGKPCDIKVGWPSPEQVIAWIRGAGGVAVLAHPGRYGMTRTRLVSFLEEFSQWGGEAMEVVSGRQLPADTRQFASLCRQFGLAASAGSDFHSPAQSWLDLGVFSTLPPDVPLVWSRWLDPR